MFRVGQKVVCVDAGERGHLRSIGLMRTKLVKGSVYTIRDIDLWDGIVGVRLEELIEPVLDCWLDREPTEPVWAPNRFRPLVETKTDISIFTKMLKGETINA